MTFFNHEQIQASREVLQSWGFPADDLDVGLFQFGANWQVRTVYCPGFFIYTTHYPALGMQHVFLRPDDLGPLVVSPALFRVDAVNLQETINRPADMPVFWRKAHPGLTGKTVFVRWTWSA